MHAFNAFRRAKEVGMEIVKSLGMFTGKSGDQKREMCLYKCECGVRVRKFKRDHDRTANKTCGYCKYIPTVVLELESQHLAKDCEIVAFRRLPREDTNMLEVIFEDKGEIKKTSFRYHADLKTIEQWADPWRKKSECGTQEQIDLPKQSNEEEKQIESEKEELTGLPKLKGEDVMLNKIETMSDGETCAGGMTTIPQNPEVLGEQSISTKTDLCQSLSLIKESANHLYNTMINLTPTLAKNANTSQVIAMSEAIATNKDIVQAKVNCAKEIRGLLTLGLDVHKFLKGS
jgi:hypothetical protein